jgi:hypothetical protein
MGLGGRKTNTEGLTFVDSPMDYVSLCHFICYFASIMVSADALLIPSISGVLLVARTTLVLENYLRISDIINIETFAKTDHLSVL